MSTSLTLDKEHLNKSGAFFIGSVVEATDKRIVINYISKKGGRIFANIAACILVLIGIFFIVLLSKFAIDGVFSDTVWALIVLAFPLMGVFVYKNTQAAKKHRVVFNRVDKTITHPESLMSTRHITQAFKVGDMYIADYQGVLQSGVKVKGLPVFNRFPIFKAFDENNIVEHWAYVQQYMFDSVLPPGTAFDDYR